MMDASECNKDGSASHNGMYMPNVDPAVRLIVPTGRYGFFWQCIVRYCILSETADQQPSSTYDESSFSFKENVKPPRNLFNKSGINSRSLCKRKSFGSKTCFVCGSKFHLIKDCDFYEKQLKLHNKPMWNYVANIPSFVPKATSVPAGSKNRPTSVPAGSRNRPTSVPAGSRNRPTSVPASRPTSHYFQHFSRPGYYNQMNMDEGRWGT
ncbi:hypothetical protein Tco_1230989, partial [Tanacetum coccineum]